MGSFLRRTLDWTLVVLARERPFFSLGALSMYSLALAAETPVIVGRFFLALLILGVVMIAGNGSSLHPGWLLLALVPTAWSISALFRPLGGAGWWRTRAGGRSPSQREQLVYQDAVELLQGYTSKPLPLPKHWFVLDVPEPDAGACGDTLMLSRALLETDYLPAVLAHELGHLGSPDGRLTAALNRLVFLALPFGKATDRGATERYRQPDTPPRREGAHDSPARRPRGNDAVHAYIDGLDQSLHELPYDFLRLLFKVTLLAKGGFGLWITGPIWGRYWRRREYKADQYATSLGQAEELADFLETHALHHDHPVPFIWLTEHTHPPTELRIDRLRNHNPEPIPATTQPAAVELRASPR
jgi:Zn-dependent protease with chaperone function